MLFAGKSTENMSEKPAKRKKDPGSLAEQLRDLAIYFAIGVPLVVGCLFEALHTSGKFWLGVPWTLFATCTALTFGIAIGQFRRHWRHLWFWLSVVALLAIHFGGRISFFRLW